ncbi:Retrotransposon-derived protein PEG10 [Smittium mucronatum]|uniref:Retrotransposon-derived protein PEG10 n=1 Tax=Smittium mucronatum TaxID=133383 RepID=A0A1R0GMD6_9FUNG|nr:Retrotransposon-derived protein PEG10 [Smittium mucronatum]
MSEQTSEKSLDSPITMALRDYNELQRMATTLSALQSRIDTLPTESNSTQKVGQICEPRVSDPENFNGRREHLRNFISQVKLVIEAQPSLFSSDRQKVIFSCTFLRGSDFSWLQPYLESTVPVPMLDSFNIFIEELHRVFGNPNKVANAEQQLRRLKQTNSATNYASEFRRFQYYEDLKDDVKDLFARFDRPQSLPELIYLSIKIDNRLFERVLEKFNRPRQSFSYTPLVQLAVNTGQSKSPQHQPMEIEGTITHRPVLKPQERQRRRDKKLCLYCGNAGNIIATCPLRPQSRITNSLSASYIDTQIVSNQNQENSSA